MSCLTFFALIRVALPKDPINYFYEVSSRKRNSYFYFLVNLEWFVPK